MVRLVVFDLILFEGDKMNCPECEHELVITENSQKDWILECPICGFWEFGGC